MDTLYGGLRSGLAYVGGTRGFIRRCSPSLWYSYFLVY